MGNDAVKNSKDKESRRHPTYGNHLIWYQKICDHNTHNIHEKTSCTHQPLPGPLALHGTITGHSELAILDFLCPYSIRGPKWMAHSQFLQGSVVFILTSTVRGVMKVIVRIFAHTIIITISSSLLLMCLFLLLMHCDIPIRTSAMHSFMVYSILANCTLYYIVFFFHMELNR